MVQSSDSGIQNMIVSVRFLYVFNGYVINNMGMLIIILVIWMISLCTSSIVPASQRHCVKLLENLVQVMLYQSRFTHFEVAL